MQFFKYSGSGNDFIFINNTKDNMSINPSQVVKWCRRREGIGADGVVLIGKSEKYDYSIRIFNADGSEAEMCGNASRCSIHFATNHLKLNGESGFIFETMNGVYRGEIVKGTEVKVKMTELFDVDSIDISDLSGKNAMYLNTGVPHAVIQVSSVDDVKVTAVGSAIRYDERFANAGTNVCFFEVLDADNQIIKLRVYERGVEDETLCCGTGIMATAVGCAKFFGWSGEIKVNVKGGLLKAIIDKEFENLYFQGNVHLMYSGEISE